MLGGKLAVVDSQQYLDELIKAFRLHFPNDASVNGGKIHFIFYVNFLTQKDFLL